MDRQHQIKRTLSEPASIEVVRGLLHGLPQRTRSALVRTVCAHFGFVDALGRPQEASCSKALRALEAAGHFVLPASLNSGNRDALRPMALAAPLAAPTSVPATVGEVRGLQLLVVETGEQRRIWKQMMQAEHPQGAGELVGAQLRYLIGSEHGWLGGFGFAASALHLADRDRWVGWDHATRREQLHRVVGMSRFLIRPSVHCANLASRVLGVVLRRLPGDFAQAYGYSPWLVESFVDSERHAGTCYQATNWVKVGQTLGRGRQDATHRTSKGVKAIYLYPLIEDLRSQLGVVPPPLPPPLGVEEGLWGPEWADKEFGGAQIGDKRLSQRLVAAARMQAMQPGEAFCAVAQGDRAAIKGYYRMINPGESAMTMAAILAPHRGRTVQRMRARQTVLCILDGTDLDYSRLVECEGLGVIGSHPSGANSAGLHLRSTFVVGTDGLPLGILAGQCAAPQPHSQDHKSFSWAVGLRDCIALAAQLPGTRQVCVMDCEAGFFELFNEQRAANLVDLLVRVPHDREASLWVPRRAAQQTLTLKTASRQALVALRYQKIELRPPAGHKAKRLLTVWAIHAWETSTPADAEPLDWLLLTTIDIAGSEQAAQCVRWHGLRGRIEDWHRVLKSGCRIEELQHEAAERLRRAIAIKMVIAWRMMLMSLLGRSPYAAHSPRVDCGRGRAIDV